VMHPRLAHPVGAPAVWRFLRCEGIAVNASDQSETASKSASNHFHAGMQRLLRHQGLSEATRDSYGRAVRRLGGGATRSRPASRRAEPEKLIP
jgi:hypothetical protein